MRASILTIGTELTTGQIVNQNAAWLSEKMTHLGLNVVLQECVPDDRPLIQIALTHCARLSELIFITGGLGPTTDDVTRDEIAKWLGLDLEFHPQVWQQVQDRLNRLGVPVAESNRQQCYFPKGAQVLPNSNGTAAGFSCETASQIAMSVASGSPNENDYSKHRNVNQEITLAATHLWTFPGPPRELHTMWNECVEPTLKALFPTLCPLRLLTWQCMGKSEAELGEITEAALAGSGLQTGYRAHRPFVEVKVWCPESEVEAKRIWIEKLDKTLLPWISTRNGKDLSEALLLALKRSEAIEIYDFATGGLLTSRIGQTLNKPALSDIRPRINLTTDWGYSNSPRDLAESTLKEADPDSATLVIAGFDSQGIGTVGLREGDRTHLKDIQLPYWQPHAPGYLERWQPYAVEIALKSWHQWLDTSTH